MPRGGRQPELVDYMTYPVSLKRKHYLFRFHSSLITISKDIIKYCFRTNVKLAIEMLISVSGQQFAQQIQQQNPELIEQLRNHIRSRSFSGSAEEHSWSQRSDIVRQKHNKSADTIITKQKSNEFDRQITLRGRTALLNLCWKCYVCLCRSIWDQESRGAGRKRCERNPFTHSSVQSNQWWGVALYLGVSGIKRKNISKHIKIQPLHRENV